MLLSDAAKAALPDLFASGPRWKGAFTRGDRAQRLRDLDALSYDFLSFDEADRERAGLTHRGATTGSQERECSLRGASRPDQELIPAGVHPAVEFPADLTQGADQLEPE